MCYENLSLSFCTDLCFHFSWAYLEIKCWPCGNKMFDILRNSKLFSKHLHHFTISTSTMPLRNAQKIRGPEQRAGRSRIEEEIHNRGHQIGHYRLLGNFVFLLSKRFKAIRKFDHKWSCDLCNILAGLSWKLCLEWPIGEGLEHRLVTGYDSDQHEQCWWLGPKEVERNMIGVWIYLEGST